jgi:hypothetical protein
MVYVVSELIVEFIFSGVLSNRPGFSGGYSGKQRTELSSAWVLLLMRIST